ncbi:MAG: PilZ domain-containing protein [Myxococcota bacterium]|jgi:hypothetical protein|nr:PilZ domain-containing protein [Myxococcota bacterium]
MSQDRREAARIAVEIPVIVTDGAKTSRFLALDVSRKGMFIKSDAPSPMRRILRLSLPMPDGSADLQVLALVVHRVSVEQALTRGVAPGMGVHLYGVGPVAKQRWEAYLETLASMSGGASSARLVTKYPGPPPIDAVKRRYERFHLELEAQLIGDELESARTIDVSAGGTLLSSSRALELGSKLDLILLHPQGETRFTANARVARVVDAADGKWDVGLEFLDLDDARRAELRRFIESCLPEPMFDDELVVLEADDPLLA